ncbi:MAG: hypothetical protein ACPG4X_16990 [Pikeienuella sp.]
MTTENPTIWRDMSDAEKGALLLAEHDGKPIEVRGPHMKNWRSKRFGVLNSTCAYRVKPDPKVETHSGEGWASEYGYGQSPSLWVNKQDGSVHGEWTATIVDGKPTKIVWEADE